MKYSDRDSDNILKTNENGPQGCYFHILSTIVKINQSLFNFIQ